MASDDDKRQLITGADSDLQFVLGEAGLSLDAQYRVVQRHTTLRRFQAIADSRAEARVAGKADFGLADDTADGRQQIAGVVAAWELARDVITKETETRAEAKVLGQPRILQVTERQAMIKAVVAVHGQLGESETPSAEYLALKCEECEVNEPQASTVDAITSKKSTLTTSIQSSLDASGRIHITQHKAKSELPTTTEAYRKVLRVEAFTWLCMAARFKSKQWLQGLRLSDFDQFVNYILGEKVAQLNVPTSHQPNDVPTLSPPWHVVLAYEHRLRKEAFRLVTQEDQTLSAALATVISSAELKETYFTTPLALSIIERPRKWYKGKGKDKDGKGLGKDPKGGYKGKDDKGGKGGKTATSDPALKGLTLVWRTPEGDVGSFLHDLGHVDTLLQFDLQRSSEHDLTKDLGATPDQEVPASIWQFPSIRELQVTTKAITFAVFQCAFEAPTSKPTRFLTNLSAFTQQPPAYATWPRFDSQNRYVGPLPPRCPHGGHDQVLAGRSGRVWATSAAAAYPPLLCEWIAHAVLTSAAHGGIRSASHSSGPEAKASLQDVGGLEAVVSEAVDRVEVVSDATVSRSAGASMLQVVPSLEADFAEAISSAKTPTRAEVVDGRRLAGRLVPITAEPAYIHAYRDLHFTMPWTGRRLVIIAFSVSDHEQAPQDVLSTLRGQSFVLPGEASQEACSSFKAPAEDAEASADSCSGSTSEGPEPFRHEDCHNEGPPLSLEWDGKVEPINDGFGLCSPTRWPPAARGSRLPARAAGFAKAMHRVLRDFLDHHIPDVRRTAMELALGRLKSSPFPPEVLEGLREEWFGCVEVALGVRSSELREIPPNQPFYLHAISSTARLLEDPDWEAIACQKDSYVTGVAIGFDEPVPHLPQVYEFKVKSCKLDDSEDEWHRDNYSSAKQTIEQLEQKFKEEEALGRMAPSTLPVLEQRYGKDRVRIASLGSLLKPDGSARPLHDGTHGVRVNNGIRMLNQQANPGPREVVHLVRSAKQSQEATFCLTGDVTAAHRLFLVRESDWPLLCCRLRDDSPVIWYNKVGTFGISSSAFLWSRLFGIIGRCAARFLLTIWFYHLVYVDDVHANFAGKDKFHHLLMWLACFEMFGTPFAYKKFRGGLTSAFVGYELSYPDQRVGISESRGQWLLKWIEEARASRFVVSVRRFAEFLGRLGFVSRLLVWLKAHLAPLYSWRAAVSVSAVARLPDTVILTLEYLSFTFKDMSFKVAAARTIRREGVAFRTDAKCADGCVVLGGWECSGTTKDSRWFSIRLTPDEAPYLFGPEGHSQWASASAELLATLAALHAFGHLEVNAQRRIMTVEVLAQTDNKANEGLAKKGSTTRWPLLMINMQLSHLLMKASLRLTLGWRPRDQNQEADALTNEVFDLFDDQHRISLQYADLPLSFLHSLYKARLLQTSSRQADAVLDAAIGKPRFKGKRKREKSPW
ncbi:FCPC [Symbiodinium necroappetens]|uniref:FCPC protein n=1 Tax=Symbiodinium necroappetens TaxID=1628268 RepID=A0A813C228_9DINO|nr:FCPC [Symbiodinium necroappetens]